MFFRATRIILKAKKRIYSNGNKYPLGLSKANFHIRRSKIGKSKPWLRPTIMSSGTVDVDIDHHALYDVVDVNDIMGSDKLNGETSNFNSNTSNSSVFSEALRKNSTRIIPPTPPLGIPTDYSFYYSKLRNAKNINMNLNTPENVRNSDSDVVPINRGINEEAIMIDNNSNSLFLSSFYGKKRDLMRLINMNKFDLNGAILAERQFSGISKAFLPNKKKTDNSVDVEREKKPYKNIINLDSEFSSYEDSKNMQMIPDDITHISTTSASMANKADILLNKNDNKDILANTKFGNQLQLNVTNMQTYSIPERNNLLHVNEQKYARSRKDIAESVKLPRHLNDLFYKIMGWRSELVEIDKSTPLVDSQNGEERDIDDQCGIDKFKDGDRREAEASLQSRREYEKLSKKMKYGVLLDAFEKDKFAIENKLIVAGLSFEKKFMDWAGVKILDNAPQQDMMEVEKNKGSILLHHASRDFTLPRLNYDCCPGCGATMQSDNDQQFGYVRPGNIENYIEFHSRMTKARCEYGDRMAELQEHWERHGRRVGEEWLDFMTEEEFQAIYRYRPSALVCDRCYSLQTKNKMTLTNHPLLSAPDFSEKLSALKEKRCLVVLVCDITDFPGSMVYDLPGHISMNNPVILVLNKLDCIQKRRPGYQGLRHFQRQIVPEKYLSTWARNLAVQFNLPSHCIKEIIPVSAKRGWNIMRLIESIEKHSNLNFAHRGPILPTYFVGVSNVGKSSVINSIAHQVYVEEPPHPLSKKVYYMKKDDKTGSESIHFRWYTPPDVHSSEMIDIRSRKNKEISKLLTVSNLPGTTVQTTAVKITLGEGRNGDNVGKNKNKKDNNTQKTYFYDTPGLYPHWWNSTPLTLLDIRRSLQFGFRNPQCFLLKEGYSLLFAGVAAIEVVKASAGFTTGVLFMVYSSRKAKHSVCRSETSDSYWAENLGTNCLPPHSLSQLGDLRLTVRKSYLFECFGKHRSRPKADLYICGMGWVSFCVEHQTDLVIRVRTLPGVVHGVREPLRVNDMYALNGRWPKLRSDHSAIKPTQPINRIIRLTAKKEVDLTKDPITPIPRAVPRETVSGNNKSFDEAVGELQRSGII